MMMVFNGFLSMSKRGEVTGERRKLRKEELNALYYSPTVLRLKISRRMRWAGHVACMGEGRVMYRCLMGKPEGKRPLGRPRCKGGIFRKSDVGVWTGLIWLRIESGAGTCECGNEP
jgi:hypothetical protein